MPYVKREVAIALDGGTKGPTTAGELTYLLTRQIQSYLDYHSEQAGGYRYENLAVCLGALEGAKMDLERRVITPYEKLAQAINGDVWPRHLLVGKGDERKDPNVPWDSLHNRTAWCYNAGMSEIQHIDIKEFRERGYLQEANRKFFHPLGLALAITVDDETGEETLSGIWDYRDDPEGIVFGGPDDYGLDVDKAQAVEEDRRKHVRARVALFGQSIQPLTNGLDKR